MGVCVWGRGPSASQVLPLPPPPKCPHPLLNSLRHGDPGRTAVVMAQRFAMPHVSPVRPCPEARRPPCDIPSRCCSFTGPWTVTRSSLRMLRRVAVFCRPLRPVLLLVSFPRSWSPVVGVPGLCWLRRDVPFERQRRPIIGVLGDVLVVAGVV